MNESCPRLESVLARDDELRIHERWLRRACYDCANTLERGRITVAQQT
jgi:hypothetical protein